MTSLLKFLFLEAVFFVIYLICSLPILYPLVAHEEILTTLEIEKTNTIETVINIISLVLLVSIVGLAHNANRLCTYFDYDFYDALLSPIELFKGFFRRNNDETRD